jgi:hypothetical protein
MKGIGLASSDWWRALVNTVMDLRVSIKGREFLDYICEFQVLKVHYASWTP